MTRPEQDDSTIRLEQDDSMSSPAEILISLLPEFRRLSAAKTPSSARSYMKGVRSLAEFLKSAVARESDAPALTMERLLAGWMLDMIVRGLTPNTSLLFFDIISGLYGASARRGLAPATEAFKTVKMNVRQALAGAEDSLLTPTDYAAVTEGARKAVLHAGAVPSLAPGLLLLSLLNPDMTLPALMAVRRRDIAAFDESSRAVLDRYASTRRQYVFDIKPRPVTDAGYMKKAELPLLRLLRQHGFKASLSPREAIESAWALTALKGGVAPEDVLGVLGRVPRGMPLLGLFAPTEIGPERLEMIKGAVSPAFSGDPFRWYAMRLRPRVKFTDLSERLGDLAGEIAVPRLFYPSEEIARRTGRRLEFESRPVIKDVVFFRSRLADILPLFSRIGDIAWCYTTTGRPGAPYAPIPRRAFERFQQTVGSFTPDYEVAPLGGLTPREGEKVVMVGGLFEGQLADVEQVRRKEAEPAIYRLRFHSDNGIEWRVATDRFIMHTR